MNPFKANLANAFLENPISDSATSLTLASGYAATLPLPPFFSTMTPQGQLSTFGNSEIILVTEVNGDTLTIIRAQKGTSAKSFQKGAIVSNGIYAESTIAIGDIVMTLNTAPSAGRLFMDGGTYTKANYPLLYKHVQNNPAYGTTGGTAGSETFTLTDMRQRMPFGKSQNSPFTTLGDFGGSVTHRHGYMPSVFWTGSQATNPASDHMETALGLNGMSVRSKPISSRYTWMTNTSGAGGRDVETWVVNTTADNGMNPYILINFEIIAG